MYKRYATLMLVMLMTVVSMLLGTMRADAAATLADGEYTIDYLVKKTDNGSVSIANDYFVKPAKLIVKNGSFEIQIQMNQSEWVTQFQVPKGDDFADAKVISRNEENNTRIVSVNVDDLATPVPIRMKIKVPDIDYSHQYTVHFEFDEKSIVATSKAPSVSEEKKEPVASASPKPSTSKEDSGSSNKPSDKTTSDQSTKQPEKPEKPEKLEPTAPSPTEPSESVPEQTAEATPPEENSATPVPEESASASPVVEETVVSNESAEPEGVAESSSEASAEVVPLEEEQSSSNNTTLIIVIIAVIIAAAGTTYYIFRRKRGAKSK
ncbi:MAG: heme uptake protein IsdC [Candidatus Cohnella colombiensis]|uniref:Heme uptake protein IsdC n=1 Tax=Candidatus Cohnella colombiensis TaxID=3121368 RepID=A0AA95EZ53_9BACL|nr:MAG: heme uptake protein IsdC [Cohnella sp.]